MYDVSATVRVKELEENSRILIEWDPDSPEVIECEWRFFSGEGDTTFVRITETGYKGSGDEIVARAIRSAALSATASSEASPSTGIARTPARWF
jgi:hypothetical protein